MFVTEGELIYDAVNSDNRRCKPIAGFEESLPYSCEQHTGVRYLKAQMEE